MNVKYCLMVIILVDSVEYVGWFSEDNCVQTVPTHFKVGHLGLL